MADELIMRLMAEYIRLRQIGYDRDQAWQTLQEATTSLTQREVARLISLLRGWEAREGRNFKPSRHDPDATQIRPPEGSNDARPQAQPSKPGVIRRIAPPAAPAEPPVVRPDMDSFGDLSPQRASASGEIECPQCHRANPADALHCYSCGRLLVQVGSTQQISQSPFDNGMPQDTYFGDGMVLYLQVKGTNELIRVVPGVSELIVGRQSSNSVMLPDIDLSQFDAERMGISRVHAALRRQGDTLILTDMGSMNHTYINGQMMHSQEVRVLRHGDELRFGRLALRVHFRREP